MKIFTIGYEKKSVAGFCDALARAGVRTLVDVRDQPWSKRPEFQQAPLRALLEARGIGYAHAGYVGNPIALRRKATSVRGALEAYRDHLRAHPALLKRFAADLPDSACLLCYERAPEECHRGVLVAELRRDGVALEVVHL